MTKKKPSLSVVIVGRNDNYQKQWLERLEFCLNYNLLNLAKAGLENSVDFHIVDHLSNTKISSVIRIQKKSSTVYFHEVSESNTNYLKFHLSYALNVGLDKPDADLILMMGADQFISSDIWKRLFDIISNGDDYSQGKDFYFLIPRKQLPPMFKFDLISYSHLDNILEKIPGSIWKFRHMKKNLGTGAGALVFKQKLLKKLIEPFSLDDDLQGDTRGQDLKLFSKLSDYVTAIDTSNLGVFCYKLPYVDGDRNKIVSLFESRKNIPVNNKFFFNYNVKTTQINGDDFDKEKEEYIRNIKISDFQTKSSNLKYNSIIKFGMRSAKHLVDYFNAGKYWSDFILTETLICLPFHTNYILGSDIFVVCVEQCTNKNSLTDVVCLTNTDLIANSELIGMVRSINDSGSLSNVTVVNTIKKENDTSFNFLIQNTVTCLILGVESFKHSGDFLMEKLNFYDLNVCCLPADVEEKYLEKMEQIFPEKYHLFNKIIFSKDKIETLKVGYFSYFWFVSSLLMCRLFFRSKPLLSKVKKWFR